MRWETSSEIAAGATLFHGLRVAPFATSSLIMVRFYQVIAHPIRGDLLETTVALLTNHRDEDYYAYEHKNTWYIGLRSHASLIIGPDGKQATRFDHEGNKESRLINGSLNDVARAFTLEYSAHGKLFGQVGFNYSAHISGQAYVPGKWPMLSLMAPCVQAAICRDSITVTGYIDSETRAVFDFIQTSLNSRTISPILGCYPPIDLQANADEYKARVGRAILEIKKGKYSKAIPSRIVSLPNRVDMLATLLRGRRANTPARTFTLNHMGIQATGFSPEIVLSITDQAAFTEALAGTQPSDGAEIKATRNKLLSDPKEVMEHVIAINGSIRRLRHLCSPESIVVKDFMTIIPRGNVYHLFSHVSGCMLPGKDGWDSLRSNITVPGLPNQGNMEAIQTFEPHPRDLFCGVVLMVNGADFFEATLVLRTVFQDQDRQWLQAGAGITALSNAEHEFTETCEKLASVAPYVVAETRH